MDRIDDADAAAGRDPFDRLRVFQVGVHPSVFVDEPRSKMFGGFVGIGFLSGEQPCAGQRRKLNTEAHQSSPMFDEIVWVRHSITLYIWATRIFRIWPPVITLGKEVMP